MRALFRMAAIAVAGAALYYAGLLNSIVVQRPERPGAVAVVVAIGAALAVIIAAVRGTGRADAADAHPSSSRGLAVRKRHGARISRMDLGRPAAALVGLDPVSQRCDR